MLQLDFDIYNEILTTWSWSVVRSFFSDWLQIVKDLQSLQPKVGRSELWLHLFAEIVFI